MTEPTLNDRTASLNRVLAYRERGRSRPRAVRLAFAFVGASLLLASVPLAIVLPEVGVPVLLAGLRLLAVEVDWAARAYSWIDWQFVQVRAWFHRQSRPTRALVVVGLLLLAVALVWLLIHQLG